MNWIKLLTNSRAMRGLVVLWVSASMCLLIVVTAITNIVLALRGQPALMELPAGLSEIATAIFTMQIGVWLRSSFLKQRAVELVDASRTAARDRAKRPSP